MRMWGFFYFHLLTCFSEGMVTMRTWIESGLLKKLTHSLEVVNLTGDRQKEEEGEEEKAGNSRTAGLDPQTCASLPRHPARYPTRTCAAFSEKTKMISLISPLAENSQIPPTYSVSRTSYMHLFSLIISNTRLPTPYHRRRTATSEPPNLPHPHQLAPISFSHSFPSRPGQRKPDSSLGTG